MRAGRGIAVLIALWVLPGPAAEAGAEYRILDRAPSEDFDAPVARVEDVTFDSFAGRWCFVNDSATAFGCTDESGTGLQTLVRSDFEAYLTGQGVSDPQLYVGETEMVAYDAQSDRLYVGNNVNAPTLCNEPGTGVQDIAALYRLTRSSPAVDWVISDHWILPSMNDCPGFPPLVFRYEGLISVDGVVFFQSSRTYTSAGGESVVRGLYEFDLGLNAFVDLNAPAFAYDTSGGFVSPRRTEYDALEEQVYVMEYSTATPDEMRLLQIDWPTRTAVFETDLIAFGADPPVSGFLHASRGVGVDSVARRMRIGNNDSTAPNALQLVMSLATVCGDLDLDTVLGAPDVSLLRTHLADPVGAPLSSAAEDRCPVILPASIGCDVLDLVVMRRQFEQGGLEPEIDPICPAAP